MATAQPPGVGGVEPIQRSVLGGKPLCKHVHSATGCALRSQCPLAHTGANGAMSAAAAEMDRLRRDAESADDRHPVWVYRENACAFTTGGVAWRRFSASYTETLEAAFARWTASGSAQPTRATLEEARRGPPLSTTSAAEVRLTGSMSVALDTMTVFNRVDAGQRRPVQRVLLSPIPVWFAVPVAAPPDADTGVRAPADAHADEVIRIAPATAAMLEFDFVTGLRSFFGLLAHEEPAWVNLCRMRLTYLDGRAFHLHRQSVAAVPGSAASDMYGHALLRTRGSLAAAAPPPLSEQRSGAASFANRLTPPPAVADATPVVQCRLTDHRVRADAAANMTERGEPAAFVLEDVVPSLAAPTVRCEGLRCVQRRGAAHLHTALHPCPNGTRAECFLCSAAAAIRGGVADGSDVGASSLMGQSARRQSLLSPVGMAASLLLPTQPGGEGPGAAAAVSPELAARAQVHAALFVSPQLAGGASVGHDDADATKAAGAEAAHEWRQRQRLNVELRRSWLAACAPEKVNMSRSRGASKGPAATSAFDGPPPPPPRLSGDADGEEVPKPHAAAAAAALLPGLVHVADDSAEHAGLLEHAAVAGATPEPRAVRVQRVPAGERYQEYLRWRNEAFEQWAAVDANAAIASGECVLYAPLKVADEALRWPDAADGPRGTLLFRTFAAALDRAVAAADAEADEERRKGRPGAVRHHDHVAVVVSYDGPPAPRHDAAADAGGTARPPMPFVVREAADRRRCLVATSETEGALAVRFHDASQFAPLYLVSVSREPAASPDAEAELLARTESMATASSATRRPKLKKKAPGATTTSKKLPEDGPPRARPSPRGLPGKKKDL